ncbi:hypothetical protein PUN28_011959 [Cardiocondyla obscurior]|uniref:Uncharacterized protein n=1 Tax=Cardiocondyla obscurior TaxID=286306 RepID=A0AAW2F9T6_9HYME
MRTSSVIHITLENFINEIIKTYFFLNVGRNMVTFDSLIEKVSLFLSHSHIIHTYSFFLFLANPAFRTSFPTIVSGLNICIFSSCLSFDVSQQRAPINSGQKKAKRYVI